MPDDRYLSASEAASILGISLQTLYAYTSRGMLRSEPAPGKPRVKRYPREDVVRLKERKEARRDPDGAAARSLHWGGPVLESAITLIENGRLYYRGRDVIELSRRATTEEVAALLWTGDRANAAQLFTSIHNQRPGGFFQTFKRLNNLGPIERCQIALPWAGAQDLAAYDLQPQAVAVTGARILSLLVAAVTGVRSSGSVDIALQQAWAPRRPVVSKALRAALILCADHELNVSAFAARCVASAAATPYDVVSAGLAALKGARHGGASARVEALFREAGVPSYAMETVAGRLRRGESVPGFGHPLYPDGDPRATSLLEFAEELGKGPVLDLSRATIEAVRMLTGKLPTIDVALATMCGALRLPQGSPLALFALGRTIGWIAHAIEQYQTGELIRPRAYYKGPAPTDTERHK